MELTPEQIYLELVKCKASPHYFVNYYCTPAETPIWMSDFRFKPISQVKVGDSVLGWSAGNGRFRGEGQTRRRMVHAIVTAVHQTPPTFILKLTMASGRIVRCTADHLWLTCDSVEGKSRNTRFREAAVGRKLMRVVNVPAPVPNQSARTAAWLGGLYDGEGCGSVIAQDFDHNPTVFERMRRSLEELGFSYGIARHKDKIKGLTILGGRDEYIRFVNWCDPSRTGGNRGTKASHWLMGSRFETDAVLKIEPDTVEHAYGLTTETGNYVAWGYASKNCRIYDNKALKWIPFSLWPLQATTLKTIHEERRVVILKARQLGITWKCLAYILWSMIYCPIAKPLVFSRTEDDAMYLLGDERLRGMYKQLPPWMIEGMNVAMLGDASRTWELANGSVAHAFPPNRGDSYTGTFAMADEFDILTDKEQNQLLRSVKPTVDAGGKFVMLSRPDKTRPNSVFKNTYRGGKAGSNNWTPVFLGWNAHPGRDQAWYDDQVRQAQSFPSPADYLAEQYPATDAEALAPNSLDKRIPGNWLLQCYRELKPLPWDLLPPGTPSIPGLEVYVKPEAGHAYRIGIDPAEGNPTSDPSALTVMDERTGEECAVLAGQIQPAVMAGYADEIGRWYNDAAVMVERNNHGHSVILWLEEHSKLQLLCGHDGKVGWLSSQKGKDLLYDRCADAFRNEETILHSFASYTQLASIEGGTLRAPEGEKDDRADSYALAGAKAETSWYTPGCLRH